MSARCNRLLTLVIALGTLGVAAAPASAETATSAIVGVSGGPGNGIILGGPGHDLLQGGAGDDEITQSSPRR